MKKKNKYDKRRAIDCKLLKKSDTHKGYCKYLVTIAELDGTIHKQPVYGKDMQGALSRLINTEITSKVENRLETSTGFVFFLWAAAFAGPLLITGTSTPWFLAYAFGSVGILVCLAALWYNYINKKD